MRRRYCNRVIALMVFFVFRVFSGVDYTNESSVAAYVKERLAYRIASWQREVVQLKKEISEQGLTQSLERLLHRIPFYIIYKKDIAVKDILSDVVLYNSNGKHDLKDFDKGFVKTLKDSSGLAFEKTIYLKRIGSELFLLDFFHTIEHELTHLEHRCNGMLVCNLKMFSSSAKNPLVGNVLKEDLPKLSYCLHNGLLYEKYLKLGFSKDKGFILKFNSQNKENITCLTKQEMKTRNREQEFEADFFGLKFHPQQNDLKTFFVENKNICIPNTEYGYMSLQERIKNLENFAQKIVQGNHLLHVLQEKTGN